MLFAAGALIVNGITPFGEQPQRSFHFGSPQPILPMTFAHEDHVSESCIGCHHNYVDDSGAGLCMTCHVQHAELLQALELQFHDLCRGCHTDKARESLASGPPRRCVACHRLETRP